MEEGEGWERRGRGVNLEEELKRCRRSSRVDRRIRAGEKKWQRERVVRNFKSLYTLDFNSFWATPLISKGVQTQSLYLYFSPFGALDKVALF